MSYHGTVYCGYCGNRGHNRLGCPARKKAARDNPDSYIARQLEYEKETRRRAIANRLCSYCREGGHNRRGCKLKKFDMKETMSRTHDYRRKLVEKMKEVGLGVGSILTIPSDPDRPGEVINYMVTGINWDYISHRMMGAAGETGHTDDSYPRWSHLEEQTLSARLVSHNVSEEQRSSGYNSWYEPGHQTSLSIMRLGFDGLHPSPEKVYWKYSYTEMDQWRATVAGPIHPDKVEAQVPEDFYTAPLPHAIDAMFNFTEDERRVRYSAPSFED